MKGKNPKENPCGIPRNSAKPRAPSKSNRHDNNKKLAVTPTPLPFNFEANIATTKYPRRYPKVGPKSPWLKLLAVTKNEFSKAPKTKKRINAKQVLLDPMIHAIRITNCGLNARGIGFIGINTEIFPKKRMEANECAFYQYTTTP